MSPIGPKRQFAAVQRYGRCRRNTGRSVDVADTAAPAPKQTNPPRSIPQANDGLPAITRSPPTFSQVSRSPLLLLLGYEVPEKTKGIS
jgi:hypothetical protein